MDGVRFTRHAVDRYIERLRPALRPRAATLELQQLADRVGTITTTPPAWWQHPAPAQAYLLLGDDVALPLLRSPAGWVAATCIARGNLPPSIRQARNRDRVQRRHRRHVKPRPQGRPRRPPDPLPAAHEAA